MTMMHMNTSLAGMDNLQACRFMQTYSLKLGIKTFVEKGISDTHKEMRQIHYRVVFQPTSINKTKKLEGKRAVESLILLNEKRDETINAKICKNVRTQQAYIWSKEATSLTAASEAIFTTGVIDTK